MIRNIKALALALVAMCALTAAGASAASAANFKSESSPTFLLGEQAETNTFTFNGGSLKCKKAAFTSGEILGTSVESVEVTPSYGECTAFGQNTVIDSSTCKLRLTASSVSAGNSGIVCASGDIIFTVGSPVVCTITVKAQTPTTSTVDYTQSGSGATRHILVRWTLSGITYTSSGGICGASGTNGTYTGSVTTKGYKNAAHTTQQAWFV